MQSSSSESVSLAAERRFTAAEKGKWKAGASPPRTELDNPTQRDCSYNVIDDSGHTIIVARHSPHTSLFDSNSPATMKYEELEDGGTDSDSGSHGPFSSNYDSDLFSSSSDEDEDKPPCPELPTEVWERVIDFVASKEVHYRDGTSVLTQDLKACTLVCWSWYHRSRFHLHHSPCLGQKRSIMSFFDIVSQLPDTPVVKMDIDLSCSDECKAEILLIPLWLTRNRKYSKSITFLRLGSIN